MNVPSVSANFLLERYQGFLLDAYGVLVDGTGAIPGAESFVERLIAEDRPWLVLTNDSSRTPDACAARYRALGVPVPDGHVVTSGSLLTPYVEERGLLGAELLVVGPPDTHKYVDEAGAHAIRPDAVDFEKAVGIVVGDDAGLDDFRDAMDAALSLAFFRRDQGLSLDLVVPNPDLVYPKRPGHFGFTAGTLAGMLEAALAQRYPAAPENTFRRLGKPHPSMFQTGIDRLGTAEVVMIGDQLATDIVGARSVGIDAALVASGLGSIPSLASSEAGPGSDVYPTYLVRTLANDP